MDYVIPSVQTTLPEGETLNSSLPTNALNKKKIIPRAKATNSILTTLSLPQSLVTSTPKPIGRSNSLRKRIPNFSVFDAKEVPIEFDGFPTPCTSSYTCGLTQSTSTHNSPRRKLLLTSFNILESPVVLRRCTSLHRNSKLRQKTETDNKKCLNIEKMNSDPNIRAQLMSASCGSGNGKGNTNDDGNGKKDRKNSDMEGKRIVARHGQMSLSLNGSMNKTNATTTATASTLPRSRTTKSPSIENKPPSESISPKSLSPTEETKLTPKTPPVTPDSPRTYLDDDLDSMYSFATTTSGRSTMSCEHPYVARNGTTFSGRKMKYVVHCSSHAGQVGADYLTPTQRAQRQIRRLKELLFLARQDLEQKDSEIVRLTREVVELRLFKASLSSPEERSTSSDAVTVREAELKTSQDVSPLVDTVDDAKSSPRHIVMQHLHLLQQQHLSESAVNEMQNSLEMASSCADSGHFEDMTSSSIHSKDSYKTAHSKDIACGSDEAIGGGSGDATTCALQNYELQRQELIRMYELRIEELIRTQDTATSEIKRNHNDKMEALLQKLAECNSRYADLVPDYEHAKEHIRELEKQLEDLQCKLTEQEEKQKKMYLYMYEKSEEAERIASVDQALELAYRAPESRVSLNELLKQLQSTQDELENIREAEYKHECGNNRALLTAKEAISLWVLGARKTIYRRLLEAQKNRTRVDPEVTLQFLKSAIYYFLTDKENSQGHLQAIESILEFTETEKQNISKARGN